VPSDADEMLVLDTSTKNVSYLALPETTQGSGEKWSGGYAFGDIIYLVPSQAPKALVVNVKTLAMLLVDLPKDVPEVRCAFCNRNFALENVIAIGSHACSLEALACV
jgi:hypothetical protein